jgi:lactate dehydrogenase-like 2-hydroxyacid dehydrogenase
MLDVIGEVDVAEKPLSPEALREAVRGRSAILSVVSDRIDSTVLDAAGPSLKIVANVAVGYDNIDVPAARARGVTVTNTPDVLNNAVAEFTWALILALTRRLGEAERQLRAGLWKGWAMDHLLGMELSGKQLGIIGAGRIGRAVGARAGAFGMTTVYAARGSAGEVDGCRVLPLEDLLATSDVVSLHVPLRPETRHLIDGQALEQMKGTAYLVNTTRGAVIDEAALAEALREGVIAGAALDVFEREPVVHPDLLRLENALLVPHLGSATRETRAAMAELAARNVVAVLAGKPALTQI